MSRPKKEDMVKYSYWEVTPLQSDFLNELILTGSVKLACQNSGMRYEDYKRTLNSENSTFVKAYEYTLKKLDDNFDYSRYRNLNDLHEVREKLLAEMNSPEADPDKLVHLVNATVKVIDQMNKMVEGNLAASKKITENRNLKLTAAIDLTKSRRENGIMDVHADDIEEIED